MRSSLGKIDARHFSFPVKTLRFRVRVPDRLLPKHLDIGCVTFFVSSQNAEVSSPCPRPPVTETPTDIGCVTFFVSSQNAKVSSPCPRPPVTETPTLDIGCVTFFGSVQNAEVSSQGLRLAGEGVDPLGIFDPRRHGGAPGPSPRGPEASGGRLRVARAGAERGGSGGGRSVEKLAPRSTESPSPG